MKLIKDEVVKKLTKTFYLALTTACIELSPKIKECFEVREAVIDNLKKAVKKA